MNTMPTMMSDSHAYWNGTWGKAERVHWSLTDVGTLQGVIIVERLRTFGGRLLGLQPHLDRLQQSLDELQIISRWPYEPLDQICYETISRNHPYYADGGDVSLVILISPGDVGWESSVQKSADSSDVLPTCIVHIAPIDWHLLSRWYRRGTALRIATIRNVPHTSVPVSMKHRSRLHYFLAAREVNQIERSSVAVLLNSSGHVTETAIANLLIGVDDRTLISPTKSDILPGVSLAMLDELAASAGLQLRYEDVHPDQLKSAREILLTGSLGCIWSARSIDGQKTLAGPRGPIVRQLTKAWQAHIGTDFVAQAIRCAQS